MDTVELGLGVGVTRPIVASFQARILVPELTMEMMTKEDIVTLQSGNEAAERRNASLEDARNQLKQEYERLYPAALSRQRKVVEQLILPEAAPRRTFKLAPKLGRPEVQKAFATHFRVDPHSLPRTRDNLSRAALFTLKICIHGSLWGGLRQDSLRGMCQLLTRVLPAIGWRPAQIKNPLVGARALKD